MESNGTPAPEEPEQSASTTDGGGSIGPNANSAANIPTPSTTVFASQAANSVAMPITSESSPSPGMDTASRPQKPSSDVQVNPRQRASQTQLSSAPYEAAVDDTSRHEMSARDDTDASHFDEYDAMLEESPELEPSFEPGAKIEDFDWDRLKGEYNSKMSAQAKEEEVVRKDFQNLLSYFEAWVNVIDGRETERAEARFERQMEKVKMEEGKLEDKRAHYQSVVKAFQGALELLAKS